MNINQRLSSGRTALEVYSFGGESGRGGNLGCMGSSNYEFTLKNRIRRLPTQEDKTSGGPFPGLLLKGNVSTLGT